MAQDYLVPLGNFAGLSPLEADFASARVAIVPVPYDATATFRQGAREGPSAIISASPELELYDVELDCEPTQLGIHTLPFVEPVLGDPKAMVGRVASVVGDLLGAGKLVGLLGGEHTITLGAVQAYAGAYPDLSVLYLDAHADLRDQYMGTGYSHASVLRRLLEICPATLVGVRSLSLEEKNCLDSPELSVVWGHQLSAGMGMERVLSSLLSQVYISVDLDVLDPSLVPAVGNPSPGGLSWRELLSILRLVAQRRRIVGFDVTELCPGAGPPACAFTAAALVYKLIGYATHPGRIPAER
ncbi:MAG: agmatinase [Chloroflexi bacterium]|nr:agmatinase [Chloroflexota bacterium]